MPSKTFGLPEKAYWEKVGWESGNEKNFLWPGYSNKTVSQWLARSLSNRLCWFPFKSPQGHPNDVRFLWQLIFTGCSTDWKSFPHSPPFLVFAFFWKQKRNYLFNPPEKANMLKKLSKEASNYQKPVQMGEIKHVSGVGNFVLFKSNSLNKYYIVK